MRRALALVLIIVLLLAFGASATIYAGVYDVGATEPHWSVTRWVFQTALIRSIKAHAAGITAPQGFNDSAKIAMGVAHFAAHCAVCHGAPGVPKRDIGRGLYPPPPDLAAASSPYSAGELFWIVKHGIKMTGMPAWSDHSDDELWAIVAFVQKLPGMTPDEYAKLLMANMAQDSQHHHGGDAAQPEHHDVPRH